MTCVLKQFASHTSEAVSTGIGTSRMQQPSSFAAFLRWREIPGGIWALGIVSLLMDLSSEMIHALLPLYLVSVMGTSAFTVGVIEGVAEATASMTKLFSGAMSDRLGGKRKLLASIGYAMAAFSKLSFPLAPSVPWLVAGRFLDRLGKGIRGAPRDALVADLSPPELRGASFGVRQSLDTVGAFLGPLLAIGLMVLTANAFTLVFWIAVLPAFLSVAAIMFGVSEPKRSAEVAKVQSPLGRAELARLGQRYWWSVGIASCFTLARLSEAFLLLRAQSVGLPIAWAPAVLVLMNIVYALAAWPAGALSDAIGRQRVLSTGFALLVAADLMLAFGSSLALLCVGVALWGLHMGLTQGLLSALVADTAPAALRGTAFGMFNLLTGVALLAASIFAGELWDVAGPRATFLAGACFTAVALIALVLLIFRHNRILQVGTQPHLEARSKWRKH
jgi:MFS family permease